MQLPRQLNSDFPERGHMNPRSSASRWSPSGGIHRSASIAQAATRRNTPHGEVFRHAGQTQPSKTTPWHGSAAKPRCGAAADRDAMGATVWFATKAASFYSPQRNRLDRRRGATDRHRLCLHLHILDGRRGGVRHRLRQGGAARGLLHQVVHRGVKPRRRHPPEGVSETVRAGARIMHPSSRITSEGARPLPVLAPGRTGGTPRPSRPRTFT